MIRICEKNPEVQFRDNGGNSPQNLLKCRKPKLTVTHMIMKISSSNLIPLSSFTFADYSWNQTSFYSSVAYPALNISQSTVVSSKASWIKKKKTIKKLNWLVKTVTCLPSIADRISLNVAWNSPMKSCFPFESQSHTVHWMLREEHNRLKFNINKASKANITKAYVLVQWYAWFNSCVFHFFHLISVDFFSPHTPHPLRIHLLPPQTSSLDTIFSAFLWSRNKTYSAGCAHHLLLLNPLWLPTYTPQRTLITTNGWNPNTQHKELEQTYHYCAPCIHALNIKWHYKLIKLWRFSAIFRTTGGWII